MNRENFKRLKIHEKWYKKPVYHSKKKNLSVCVKIRDAVKFENGTL